jgi:predicted nucleotidyltransferase
MSKKQLEKESINPAYKEMILRALEYHFPNAKIYLFGSRARKSHKEGADVDIALDTGNIIPNRELYRAKITLQNLIMPLKVDLVDVNNIPQELRQVIDQEGEIWKN